MESIIRQYDNEMDFCEAVLINSANNPNSVIRFINAPVRHFFTPKMYSREILMPYDPTGTVVMSKTHLTTHPFNISKGKVWVSVDNGEWEILSAPYNGVTKAGTRRALIILEDTIWTTHHVVDFITGDENNLPEDEKDKIAEIIGDIILDKRENEYIGGAVFNNKITKTKQIES